MYFLGGAGLGLDYARPGNITVRVFAASKIGINPGRNLSDYDADNKNAHTHAWIQVSSFCNFLARLPREGAYSR